MARLFILSSTFPTESKAPFVRNYVIRIARLYPETTIDFLTPAPTSTQTWLEFPKNVKIHPFKYAPEKYLSLSTNSIPDSIKRNRILSLLILPFIVMQFSQFLILFIRLRPTKVVSFWYFPQSIYVSIIARLRHKKRVENIVIVAGTDMILLEKLRLFLRIFYWIFPKPNVLVAVSRNFQYRILALNLFNESKVLYNPLGYDSIFKKPNQEIRNSKELIFLFVGRLSKQKDPLRALKLFFEFQKLYPNCVMKFYGEGDLLEELESFVNKYGMQQSVTFLGSISQSALAEAMMMSDILIAPSRLNEGLPLVIQEAMAAGLLVIATAIGGIPELVKHGITGYLLESETHNDIRFVNELFNTRENWLSVRKKANMSIETISGNSSNFIWHEILGTKGFSK